MKKICLAISLISAQLIGLSCTMNRQQQVVERSKKDTPAWIEQSPLQLQETEAAKQMLMIRKSMRDLPLAIKQTQFQALANLKRKLMDALADPIREKLGEQNIEARKELDGLVEDLGRNEIWNQLRVQDIYYETLASQGPITGDAKSTHDVYVLVQMADEDFQRLEKLFQSLIGSAKTAALSQISVRSPKSEL